MRIHGTRSDFASALVRSVSCCMIWLIPGGETIKAASCNRIDSKTERETSAIVKKVGERE